ncbi:cysteine hydrolase family protein [Streptomyces sp. NPDC048291]|uniref:cysteine hydrolase family protein n=1 Tax=Streptomyces sp. NPDC048291 TaxID=3365530 RepID=UPI00371696E5
MNTVGNTVLIVVDIQGGDVEPSAARTEIPHMDGRAERMPRVHELIRRTREQGIPVVWIQEVHKPNLVDIGRELDGSEGPHCVEGWAETELSQGLRPRPDEFLIRKRRYSAFFGTELEIVLKAYRAETVILIGGLTDVCVHYTAVDAHQHDYRVRVVTDCVGGSSRDAHDAALRAIHYLQRDALVEQHEVMRWLDTAVPNPEVERADRTHLAGRTA